MQIQVNDRIVINIPLKTSGFQLLVDGKAVGRLQSFCLAADCDHVQTLRELHFARSPSGGPDPAVLAVLEEAGFGICVHDVSAPPNPLSARPKDNDPDRT